MNHKIEKMPPLEIIDDKGKLIKINGYAFMDESGSCIIIVYGEGRRDAMSKYLNSDTDPLGIKYRIINLLP
jgi:hypothetical protein